MHIAKKALFVFLMVFFNLFMKRLQLELISGMAFDLNICLLPKKKNGKDWILTLLLASNDQWPLW